jgi:hypothetical protein
MSRMLHALLLGLGLLMPGLAAAQAPAAPVYQVDPFWPKPLPNRWGIGQAAGVAVDARDHVWVIHRPRTMTKDELGAAQTPPWSECCIAAPAGRRTSTASTWMRATMSGSPAMAPTTTSS